MNTKPPDDGLANQSIHNAFKDDNEVLHEDIHEDAHGDYENVHEVHEHVHDQDYKDVHEEEHENVHIKDYEDAHAVHDDVPEGDTNDNHQAVPEGDTNDNHQAVPEGDTNDNHQAVPEGDTNDNHQAVPEGDTNDNPQAVNNDDNGDVHGIAHEKDDKEPPDKALVAGDLCLYPVARPRTTRQLAYRRRESMNNHFCTREPCSALVLAFAGANRSHVLLRTIAWALVKRMFCTERQRTLQQVYDMNRGQSRESSLLFAADNRRRLLPETHALSLVQGRFLIVQLTGFHKFYEMFGGNSCTTVVNLMPPLAGSVLPINNSTGSNIWLVVPERFFGTCILRYISVNAGDISHPLDPSVNNVVSTGDSSIAGQVSVSAEAQAEYYHPLHAARRGLPRAVQETVVNLMPPLAGSVLPINNSTGSNIWLVVPERFFGTCILRYISVNAGDISHPLDPSVNNVVSTGDSSIAGQVSVSAEAQAEYYHLLHAARRGLSKAVQEAPLVIGAGNFPSDSTIRSTGRQLTPGEPRAAYTPDGPAAAALTPGRDCATLTPDRPCAALTPGGPCEENIAVSYTEATFHDTRVVAQRTVNDQGNRDASVQAADPATRNLPLPVQESDTSSDVDLRMSAPRNHPPAALTTDVDLSVGASRNNPPHPIATDVVIHSDDECCDFSSLGVTIKRKYRLGTQHVEQLRCARCIQRPIQCTNLPCGCRCYCLQCVGITSRCGSCSRRIKNFSV